MKYSLLRSHPAQLGVPTIRRQNVSVGGDPSSERPTTSKARIAATHNSSPRPIVNVSPVLEPIVAIGAVTQAAE
jgi:hypothetical protein